MVQCRAHLYRRVVRVLRVEVKVSANKLTEKPYLKWLALFIASGTLLCCALPILLVTLGFGAVVASLNYNIPGLIFFAEHKVWTLTFAALVLVALAWVIWRPNQHCPADTALAALCEKSKRWNKKIFWLSSIIWFIGLFTSYLLLPIRNLLTL